ISGQNTEIFKSLFKSPNVYYSIAFELWNSDIQKGNIRESFFAAQVGKDYQVFSSMNTDFLVTHKDRRIEIEVGGKSKRRKQINDLEDAFVFKDGIEIGYSDSILLYLAGFLY
ncbi:MAG: ATP-binding protein, partial [bacterium]|nr:ATP-binding protein [bacterium]